MKQAICPVCGCERAERKFFKNGFAIFRCPECTVEFVSPFPEDTTLGEYYDDESYHAQERYQPTMVRTRQAKTWSQRLKQIRATMPNGNLLLDIGCATGIFLQFARDQGWEVEGLEISKPAARIAARLVGEEKIHAVDLLDFHSEKKYDCITLWALIEHVKAPAAYLYRINQLLTTGGCLALSTPNTASFSRKLLGKDWRYYIPPEHIIYFNRQSLSFLLQKAGFEIVKIKTHSNLTALFRRDSTLLRLYDNNILFRLIVKTLLSPVLLLNRWFHLGETMEFYARKTDDRPF